MRNITPQHLRCPAGYCESIHKLDDGRLLIVGKDATLDEKTAERIGRHVGQVQLSWDEKAVIISPDLLADVEREWRTIDSAPKEPDWRKSARILGFHKRLHLTLIIQWSEHDQMWLSGQGNNQGFLPDEFSNWLPLPSPPKPLNEREQG